MGHRRATRMIAAVLPIGWRMLYAPEDAPVDTETDGDGVLAPFDEFPNDPTRF